MAGVTAVVLTLNEEPRLAACLDTLSWADEVLVLDSFSADGTVAIARQHGARVEQRRFDDYAHQRNAALAAVGQPWVLFVDADERVPKALADEIRATLAAVDRGELAAVSFSIPRHNYMLGRLVSHGGWWPDRQMRLLRVGAACYDESQPVHEVVVFDGSAGELAAPLDHCNYERLGQFFDKQRRYARLEARRLLAAGQPAPFRKSLTQPLRAFQRRYLTLEGWKDGLMGLFLGLLMAYYAWLVYRELRRLRREAP